MGVVLIAYSCRYAYVGFRGIVLGLNTGLHTEHKGRCVMVAACLRHVFVPLLLVSSLFLPAVLSASRAVRARCRQYQCGFVSGTEIHTVSCLHVIMSGHCKHQLLHARAGARSERLVCVCNGYVRHHGRICISTMTAGQHHAPGVG